MTRNNMYVFAIEPERSRRRRCRRLGLARLSAARSRAGAPACRLAQPAKHATIFGFALWWECTLAPGVVLSTSPYTPRTHWDQIYLPLLEPLAVQAGDELTLALETETGGDESGIEVRWTVRHAAAAVPDRADAVDRRGFLG